MLSLTEIAQKLGGEMMHGSSGPYVKAPGMGHSADDRSLSIKLANNDDGFIVHCFAGDDWQATKDWIREKLGLPKFQSKKKTNRNGNGGGPPWTSLSEHVYQTAEGKPYLLVKKYVDGHGKKQYPQSHWDDDGQLLKGKPAGPKIPYMLPELIKAQISTPVYFCEGEKDADALAKLGFVATTASEGAKAAWDPAMTEHFAGRTVIILPDADIPGRNHAQKVAKALSGTAHGIYVVDLFPGRGDGSDVSVFLEQDPSGEKLAQLARETPEWTSGAETQKDEALVIELAGLKGLNYAKRKKETAKALGVGVQDLEKAVSEARAGAEHQPEHWAVEPWPESVSIKPLLDKLSGTYTEHAVLPAYGGIGMALWVMHAWTADAAWISPFLMFSSPEMRCGKSTAMELLLWTAPRAVMASNISPAVFYRYVDRDHPTLLIDEAETYIQREDTRGILDSGHTRASAYTIGCVGDASEPKLFSTWGPKVIAGIGKMPATIRDRSIILPMKRKRLAEKVRKLCGRDTDEFRALRRQACRWANDNIAILKEAKPARLDELNDRAADNWEPLFAIADLAGPEWQAKARAAALGLSGSDFEADSLGVQLLAAIKGLIAFAEETSNIDHLTSEAVVESLLKDETGPWVAYGKMQRPITQRQVASLLSPYGIRPDSIWVAETGKTRKGYKFAWFKDAFEAYLDIPLIRSGSPEGFNNDGPNLHFSSGRPDEHLPDRKCKKPNNDGHPSGLPDRKGGNGKIPESEGETASESCTTGMAQACRYCSGPLDGTEVTCSVAGVEVQLHRKCIDGWQAAAATMSAEELLQIYR